MRGAWLVMKKEFLELSKDRKTLFFMFVMPLILYPALFGMMSKMHERDESQRKGKPSRIHVVDPSSTLIPILQADAKDFQLVPDPGEDMQKALRDKKLDLSLEVPASAADDLKAQRTIKVTAFYNKSEDDSTEAFSRLDEMLKAQRDIWVKARLQEAKAPADLAAPTAIVERDASDETLEKQKLLGILVPYIVLIAMFGPIMGQGSGMTAGERERGTLMSLLSTRIPRSQIALGKLMALFALGVLGMASNVLAISFSANSMIGHPAAPAGAAAQASSSLLQVASPGTLGLMFLVLVPVALVMVSFVLTVGIRAKTQREAATALMPGMFVIVVLGVFSMSPGLENMTVIHFVPIINASMSIREMFGQQFNWGHYLLAIGINSALAAIFTYVAAKTLDREDVLFKS
ncbi:MAG TPA: ABC transporter permease [Holophagaceae bacterium]|nr:ABC transporter permease [Holophagaceae bacterium]